MRSKDQKVFNLISHTVMILVTVMAVLPFVLVFLSSITEENTLVLNGYSFFPEKFSLYAYEYIVMKGKKIFRAYAVTLFVTVVGTSINLSHAGISTFLKGSAGETDLYLLRGIYTAV